MIISILGLVVAPLVIGWFYSNQVDPDLNPDYYKE
jgi:hypothetical protein